MPKRLDRFCGFNINLIIGSAIITCLYAVSSIVWIAIALTDDKNRLSESFGRPEKWDLDGIKDFVKNVVTIVVVTTINLSRNIVNHVRNLKVIGGILLIYLISLVILTFVMGYLITDKFWFGKLGMGFVYLVTGVPLLLLDDYFFLMLISIYNKVHDDETSLVRRAANINMIGR